MNRAPGSVALLLAVIATPLFAQGAPWGAPPGANPWYPGAAPGYSGGYPSYPGAQPTPWARPAEPSRAAAAPAEPRLEIAVEVTHTYVHQNLVVTLDVISDGNLTRVITETPRSEAALFRQLGDPTAEARTRDGRREIVNRLHYQLTPLKPGPIELKPIRVTGTHADGREFDVTADAPIHLEAFPPDPSVRPWLPLHELELSARLVGDELMGEGRPLTLIVEQSAVGMTGAQLPSPEGPLKRGDHRLYRESTESEEAVSVDGRLVGRRVDRFTLVPQQGGRLEIPAVEVAWWNVDKGRAERSIIPARRLDVAGSERPADKGKEAVEKSGATPIGFWIALVVSAFLAGVGWRWLWSSGGAFSERLRRWVVEASAPLRRRVAERLHRIAPRRHLHRARRRFADLLPRALRLRFCVRAADGEEDPEAWAQVLRFLLERRLGISAQQPMSRIAEALIAIHPGANAERLHALLDQLEAALFGGVPIADFARWKREFNRQIQPHPLAWIRPAFRRRAKPRLPDLNPETR